MKLHLENELIKVIENPLPQNYNIKDIKYFENSKFSIFDSVKIFSIQNVFYFPEIILFRYGIFKRVLTNRNLNNLKYLLLVFKKIIFRKTVFLKDDYLLIIDNWSQGYFHWVSDSLQRLYYFQKNANSANVKLLLPLSYKKISYISESLKLFNYKVVYVSEANNYFLNKIFIPSHIGSSGHYYPILIQSISDYFINQNSIANTKKSIFQLKKPFVYISRKFAEKRKIINELELCEFLTLIDFQIIYMENLSFFDQISLMKNCKILLSIHGSGLVNCLFQQPNSIVIEIRHNKDFVNNCFYLLASSLGHKYSYFLSEGSSEDPHVSDLSIDMNLFKKFINRIINEYV